jgi:hypothetical protein
MENKIIEAGSDTLAFKLLCEVLGNNPETVANTLTGANDDVVEQIIDGILLANTEQDIETAVSLFNAELASQK